MTKRDFFRCFYPAWQKAFTEKNVSSSWCKTGLFPFNPGLVLEKLRPRTQKEPTSRGRSRGPSSSPSACWDSPSGMRKLRATINERVDKKTKKMIQRLSDDLQSSRAEATLERLGKQKAIEALRHEKKKRKRGKKLMEQFRADEGSGAILFSPGKVKAAFELQERREREKVQEKEKQEIRAQERAAAKAQKQQELQRKRHDKAVARSAREAAKALKKAQRTADKEARKAEKQIKNVPKASSGKKRGRPKKKDTLPEPTVIKNAAKAQEAPIQLRSRSGRAIQTPARLLT